MNRNSKEQKSRINFAIETNQLAITDNSQILIFNPPQNIDLTLLNNNQISAVQTFYPTYKVLLDRALSVSPYPNKNCEPDICIIFCDKSKSTTLGFIYEAVSLLKFGGLILIDGFKKNGVDSVKKELESIFDTVFSISKYHGKLIWFTKDIYSEKNIEEWAFKYRKLDDGNITFPGTFSSKNIDPGSLLLVNTMPELYGDIADFGSGWGYISKQVLKSKSISKIDLIDANYHAVIASRRNIHDERAKFFWNDVNTFSGGPYDTVFTNPPFHISREANHKLGIFFIQKAQSVLKKNGTLWIVANKNLPYEETMKNCFKEIKSVVTNGGYKVLLGVKPSK